MVRKPKATSTKNRRSFLKVAGALGVTGIAGCVSGGGSNGGNSGTKTGKSGSKGTTKLEYWTPFSGGDGDAMKNLVDKFNSQHDKIQINRQRQPFEQYYDKLFTAMTGGNAPDMAVFHVTRLARFKDAIQPLNDLVPSDTGKKYVDAIWKQTQIDGNRLTLPLDTHPNGLYYNKDVFKAAGLDPEKPPTSFKELQTVADAVHSKTDKSAFNPEPYLDYFPRQYGAWLDAAGGTLLNKDKSAAAFDDSTGVDLAKFYSEITGTWNWDKADATKERGTKAFRTGDMGLTINGTWYYAVLSQKSFNWGMTKPFVAPGMKKNRTWANSHSIGVPRRSGRSKEETQAAVKATQWLTQNSLTWGQQAGHLPADKDVLSSSKLRKADVWKKTLSTFYDMAQNDELYYFPRTKNNNDYKRPINQALKQVYSQQTDPSAAMKQAASKVNGNLS